MAIIDYMLIKTKKKEAWEGIADALPKKLNSAKGTRKPRNPVFYVVQKIGKMDIDYNCATDVIDGWRFIEIFNHNQKMEIILHKIRQLSGELGFLGQLFYEKCWNPNQPFIEAGKIKIELPKGIYFNFWLEEVIKFFLGTKLLYGKITRIVLRGSRPYYYLGRDFGYQNRGIRYQNGLTASQMTLAAAPAEARKPPGIIKFIPEKNGFAIELSG